MFLALFCDFFLAKNCRDKLALICDTILKLTEASLSVSSSQFVNNHSGNFGPLLQ